MFFTIVALLVVIFTLVFRSCTRPKDFPPGPRWFPFIGSWYDVPPQGIENKIPSWRKRYGDIIGHKIGSKLFIIVCGHEKTVHALKHPNFQNRIHNTFANYRTFYKVLGLFFGDGPQWTEVRHFTLRFLGQIAYNKLELIAERELSQFMASIETDKIVEVNNDFYKFPVDTTMSLLIDKKSDELNEELRSFTELGSRFMKAGRPTGFELFNPILMMFCLPKEQREITKYSNEFFRKRIQEHRDTLTEEHVRDYIDAFLIEQNREQKSNNNNNYYSDEELLTCLFELTIAGGVAIGHVLCFILMYVSMNPKVQEKIHEELDSVIADDRSPTLRDKPSLPYCEAVVYETMRINTTAPIPVNHVVTQDTKFDQYVFPKGSTLSCGLRDIFLDPQEYEQPESFLPERFLSKEAKMKLINFGLGKRVCVGEQYAKQVLFLFVAGFFNKFSIKLPEGYEKPDTEACFGFTTSPKPFKLVITKRDTA